MEKLPSNYTLKYWSVSSSVSKISSPTGEEKIVKTYTQRIAETEPIFILPSHISDQTHQSYPQDDALLKVKAEKLQSQLWRKFDEKFFTEKIDLLNAQLEGYPSEALAKIKVVLPKPYTPAWEALHDKEEAPLTPEENIKVLGVTIWNLLLDPAAVEHKEQVLTLMVYLIELISPLIANAEQYTESLFPNGTLPHLFDWLIKIDVDFCLQTIVHYFSVEETSPGYRFIRTHCPFISQDEIREMKNYPKTLHPSFLFVALHRYIEYLFENNHYYATVKRFLDKLLRGQAGFEQTNKEGDTALLYALKHKTVTTHHEKFHLFIEQLLSKGADYNVQNDRGISPLMVACQRAQQVMVGLLLKQTDIKINALDHIGKSALVYAIEQGNLSVLSLLLQQPNIDVNGVDCLGKSALDYALAQHNFSLLQALLRHPTLDVNVVIARNQLISRLVYAVAHDQLSTVMHLLQTEQIDLQVMLMAFNYVLWEEKEEIMTCFLLSMAEEKRGEFIDQAILYAEKYMIKVALKKMYPVKVNIFMHTVAGPLLKNIGLQQVVDELKHTEIWLPDAYTPAWKALKNKRTVETFAEWIKISYIAGWSFLLHPIVQKNPDNLAVRLMLLLISLSKYIKNVQEHAMSLFPSHSLFRGFYNSFPNKLLNRLASYHVEYCLQFVVQHFPINHARQKVYPLTTQVKEIASSGCPVAKFIAERASFITLQDIEEINQATHPSFLFLALQVHIHELFTENPQPEPANQLFEMLLESSGEIEQYNKQGDTPLLYVLKHDAVAKNPKKLKILVARLLEGGARYNVKDKIGRTPLMIACLRSQEAFVTLLLKQADIDVNAKDHSDKTVLDYAIKHSNFPIIHALLCHSKIDINSGISKNQLIRRLIYAINNEDLSCLQHLLGSIKEEDADTRLIAFNYALWQGKEEMINVFLQGRDLVRKG
jgi:ankyrin repeat protein